MKASSEEAGSEVLFNIFETMVKIEKRHEDLFDADWKAIYVLQLLRRAGTLSVGEIAEKLGSKAFTASRMVSRMVEQGLVKTQRDSEDGRVVKVAIARGGTAKLQAVEKDGRKVVGAAFGGRGSVGVGDFISGLKNLHEPLVE